MREGVIYETPQSMIAKAKIAGDCVRELGLTMPCLLDRLDGLAQQAYRGWPARVCIVGKDGKVAHISAAGPRGANPQSLQRELERLFPAPAQLPDA